VALLLPTVAGETIIAPNPRGFADADTQGRDYVAVAAGASDSTIGDLAVLTTVKCDPDVGCDRDVWYRFMHAPSRSPTLNGVSGDLANAQDACTLAPPTPAADPGDVDGIVAALTPFPTAAALYASTLAARMQAGCYNPAFKFLFSDLPVATSAADESDAFTDGRWVVYATGPAAGPKDVYRFDARNPDDAPVLVAGSAADEVPFGLGGEWIGVRTTIAEGRQSLAVKRFDAAGALLSTRVLGEVNMTDGASMSARRVAWSGGHTLFFHHLAASEAGALVPLTTYLYDFEAAYAEPSVDRDTVAYVKSTLCTSGATCNSVDFDPPQFSEVRLRKFTTDGTPDALPTFTDVAIGTAATSSFSQTTQTCDGLTVPRTRTATFVSRRSRRIVPASR